ncbi:hypothetical protein HAX54_029987 [Datura stramonium]|uniref:MADS-box domain-containing protein n=1 Tax=Datura stramonium TaxID=4076 RepID=A0ABS8SAL0_DATST|nr:hypothetical protein [Datura stramonium]
MIRKKVKFALTESIIGRKASYTKRQKEFLRKAHELSILCDVEMAIVIYSPYHNEPKVFPNHDDAINTFTKFMESSVLKQSKNMVTQEEFTKQRIKKLEEQLRKVCKVIKMKTDKMGSTLIAPQPIVESIVPGGTSSEGPRAPLLDLVGAPVSVLSLVAPSTVPDRTNFKETRTPLLVPIVAPISMVPPVSSSIVPPPSLAQVTQPMFYPVAPLRTPPQTVPLVNDLWISPSPNPPPLFPSEMFPPMVLQMYPPIPQQMALKRGPGKAPPIPPTIMASPTPSPMMDPPMSAPIFSPMTSQIDPSMNIPQMDTSMPMNNY